MRPSKVATINDLKVLYRKELLFRKICYGVLILIALFTFVLLRSSFLKAALIIGLIISFPVGVGLFYLLYTFWKLLKLPDITHNEKKKVGNFMVDDIEDLVNDVIRKMKASVQLDIKITEDKVFNMWIFIFKIRLLRKLFKDKHLLLISEMLLYILSKNELRAVIAHEIGHHLAPPSRSFLLNEYWADYYACKYDNPVALINALLKMDQHSYFLNVFLQRSIHLSEVLLKKKHVNQEFWEFMFQNIRMPLKSKNDANKQAKELLYKYAHTNAIKLRKRHFIMRLFFRLKKRKKSDILQRKELSKRLFIHWSHYDNRIVNHYLDKYELLELYKTLKQDKTITINRFHFLDRPHDTHPNTNRRVVFIIENFLLPEDSFSSGIGCFP